MRKLDCKNVLLEDQIKVLDGRLFSAGIKVTQPEVKLSIVNEELRKATVTIKSLKCENTHLEGIISTHEREKERLLQELRRFTKGKATSNVLEAELHRKVRQSDIVKVSNRVTNSLFSGVAAQRAAQTDISGLKSHLMQFTEQEYKALFCK